MAKKDGTLVFFEVKTLKNSEIIKPFESVYHRKQEKIKISALEFLQKTKEKYHSIRFDVISIIGDSTSCQIEHIVNAFD